MSVLLISTAMSHTQLSEGEVATLLGQVNKKMKASEVAFETLREQLEKEEQELQNKVDGYRLVTADYIYFGNYLALYSYFELIHFTGVCVYICVCVCVHTHTVFLMGLIIPILSNDPALLIHCIFVKSIHDLILPHMNICLCVHYCMS